MEIINRKQYVDRVLGYLGKGLILVLTGQRRVGKSCILQSVAKQITAKDDSANVIYINKEYAEFNSLKTDEDLNEYVAAHLKDQRHNYLFVDEVQDIDGFENALRNFQAKDLCDIVVTSGAIQCERVHFDMGQLCDEVSERYDAVCAQNGWELKLELPEEELPVYADPDMMQRALHNLLGNAMHHIGEDGLFFLRAFKCPEGVRVEVEDHGPGISAEDLPYIFDRYYRSRSDAGKQGTGLGLSITKAIFQQHGFRFGVHSTVGKGTVFWFIMTDTEEVSS